MDQTTIEYLIAVLAMQFGQYEVATRLISNILVSPVVNERMKERARGVRAILAMKVREAKQNSNE